MSLPHERHGWRTTPTAGELPSPPYPPSPPLERAAGRSPHGSGGGGASPPMLCCPRGWRVRASPCGSSCGGSEWPSAWCCGVSPGRPWFAGAAAPGCGVVARSGMWWRRIWVSPAQIRSRRLSASSGERRHGSAGVPLRRRCVADSLRSGWSGVGGSGAPAPGSGREAGVGWAEARASGAAPVVGWFGGGAWLHWCCST